MEHADGHSPGWCALCPRRPVHPPIQRPVGQQAHPACARCWVTSWEGRGEERKQADLGFLASDCLRDPVSLPGVEGAPGDSDSWPPKPARGGPAPTVGLVTLGCTPLLVTHWHRPRDFWKPHRAGAEPVCSVLTENTVQLVRLFEGTRRGGVPERGLDPGCGRSQRWSGRMSRLGQRHSHFGPENSKGPGLRRAVFLSSE